MINPHCHLHFHYCEGHSDVVRRTPDMMIDRELHASRRGGNQGGRGHMFMANTYPTMGGLLLLIICFSYLLLLFELVFASVSDSLAFRKFVELLVIYRLTAKQTGQ